MSCPNALLQWERTVSSHLPHLSGPQAQVLALWSYGMVLAKSCGITSVVALLAPLLEQSESTLRQRLREWCYPSSRKKGGQRQALEVSLCFAPLLRWVVSWWDPSEPRLALAIDASTLTDRFTVLAVSVLYHGCAIPVAWKIVRANAPGSWEPYWKELLRQLAGAVPADWTVLVLADRGLYAKWLFEHLVSMGWHPFLRINRGGKVRPVGEKHFRWLSSLVPKPGTSWSGVVDCFAEASCRLHCTVLAHWEKSETEIWLVVTDLAPEAANIVWYSMRSWIEAGFKDTKRGGWQWHQTKMTEPERAERLWVAIAVATLWVVSVGGQAEANPSCSGLEALPPAHIARRTATARSRPRLSSCFAQGLRLILVAVLRHEAVPQGRLLAASWPDTLPPRNKTKAKTKGKTKGKTPAKKNPAQKQRWRASRRASKGAS
jgi:hypothetical protein